MAGEIQTVLDQLETLIADKKGLGVSCVSANSANRQPTYPYISYTLSTIQENAGTWGEYSDGERKKPFSFVVSFTVQSDKADEALEIAENLHDFLDSKNPLLDEKGIIVVRCQAVSSRDTLLTYEYEYRQGFDVVFTVMRTLNSKLSPAPEEVEVELNQEVIK